MRTLVVSLVTSGMVLAFAPAAKAVTITFDEFGSVGTVGPVIDDEYAALGVLFSSTNGQDVWSTRALRCAAVITGASTASTICG